MSSTINSPLQVSPAAGQLDPSLQAPADHGHDSGRPGATADAKARMQADGDAAADVAANKRVKDLAAQSPQDISAAHISRMLVATGTAGLGASVPELPPVKVANPASAAREAVTTLAGLSSGGIMAYSAISAALLMREAGEKSFDAQAKAHQLNQQGQRNAQMDSAKQAENKAKADKGTAVMTLLGSAAAVTATYGTAAKGSGSAKAAESKRESSISAQKASSVAQPTQDASESGAAARRAARTNKEVNEDKKMAEAEARSETATTDHRLEKMETKEALEKETESIKKTNDEWQEKTDKKNSLDNDSGARRAGIYAASAGIGQLITSGTEAANQNLFFGKDSHEAEVAGKYDDVLSTVYKMSEDSSKTGKEKAQKMIDDAISGLKQHFDLVKSTNDRIG